MTLNNEVAPAPKPAKIKKRVILAGIIMAVISAVIWTLLVVITEYEIGYMAVGVGLAVGYSMLYFNGKERGRQLQIIASIVSIIGILVAKYITFAYFLAQELATYPEYEEIGFSGVLINTYTPVIMYENFMYIFTSFDALWVLIAVSVAWQTTGIAKAKETGAETKTNVDKVLAETQSKLAEEKAVDK